MRAVSLHVALALALGCGSEPTESSSAALGATQPGPATPALDLLDRLDEGSRRAIAAAPTERVLLLPDAHIDGAVVMSGPHFFAINKREGDLTIMLHATDVVHQALPDDAVLPQADLAVRGKPAMESMNDGIRGVTWTEAGMTYELQVECYDALTDPRCVRDDFIRALAESLVEHGR